MLTKDDKTAIAEIMSTAMRPLKKSLHEMNSKLDTTIRFFDSSTVSHEKRIKRIEKHLDLPSVVD